MLMTEGFEPAKKKVLAVAQSIHESWITASTLQLHAFKETSRSWKYVLYVIVSMFSAALAVMEAILVGLPSNERVDDVQLAVLAISTLLFLVSIILVADVIKAQVGRRPDLPADNACGTLGLQQSVDLNAKALSPEDAQPNFYLVSAFQRSTLFEGACLVIGWACIIEARGLAAIRCCRVFCVLHVVQVVTTLEADLFSALSQNLMGDMTNGACDLVIGWIVYFPRHILNQIPKICELALFYLRQVHDELFTTKSRGGAVVLIIFFYTSYVVAVVLYRDRDLFQNFVDPTNLQNGLINSNSTSQDWHCITLRNCWFNVLRLSFYDGNGFDLLTSVLYARSWHLFLLLIVFMCFTAIILLNGLIGIFGHAFDVEEETTRNPPIEDPMTQLHGGLEQFRGVLEFWVKSDGTGQNRCHVESNNGGSEHITATLQDGPDNQNTLCCKWLSITRPFAKFRISEEYKSSLLLKGYFAVCFLLSLAETILIGCPTNDAQQAGLWTILALSSVCFVIGLHVMTVVIKEFQIDCGHRGMWDAPLSYLGALLQPAAKFEVACLILGWACMFKAPGFSCLRCFRIFRVLWNLELYDPIDKTAKRSGVDSFLSHVCHLSLKYFKRLGRELFSHGSRGGLIVLAIFFYVTYLVAVVLWHDKGIFNMVDPTAFQNGTVNYDQVSSVASCATLDACWITMLRLSMYDGNGFDFLATIMNSGSWWLVAVLIAYMCFAAIVLLNGLIGIFGQAFQIPEKPTEPNTSIKPFHVAMVGYPAGPGGTWPAPATTGLCLTIEQLDEMRDIHARIQHLLCSLEASAAKQSHVNVEIAHVPADPEH